MHTPRDDPAVPRDGIDSPAAGDALRVAPDEQRDPFAPEEIRSALEYRARSSGTRGEQGGTD